MSSLQPAIELTLGHAGSAPRQARDALYEALSNPAFDHLVDDVVLAASELVSNSVLHTTNECHLAVWCHSAPPWVRVEVHDDDSELPRIPESSGAPTPASLDGRGLRIVDQLATAWGVTPESIGKRVWFEVGDNGHRPDVAYPTVTYPTVNRPGVTESHLRAEREAARMAAVRRYDILDSPPDGAFDRITALAARLLDVPVAIVSIVDTDRIWFKSHHGVDVNEIGRDPGLCASAILQQGPWIIEDTRSDPRTLSNPIVAGESGFGFYFGVPLRTADGHNLGTLCVLDQSARTVNGREIAHLSDLAAIVMDELELRMKAGRVFSIEAEHRRQAEQLAQTLQESLLPTIPPEMTGVELAARYVPANRERVGGDFYETFTADGINGLFVGDVCGHGPGAAALASMARHTLRAYATGDWSPGDVLTRLNKAMVDGQRGDRRFCTLALVRLDATVAGADVTVSLGGHPCPFVIRADGSVEPIGVPGSLVGWSHAFTYQQTLVQLRTGDSLVLFTDGLIELGRGRRLFGNDEFAETLRTWPGRTAADLVDWVIAAVDAVPALPDDDIAILVARVTG